MGRYEDQILEPAEAAAYLRRTTDYLAYLRRIGKGPAYLRHGEGPGCRIQYRRSDLDAYLESLRVDPAAQGAA